MLKLARSQEPVTVLQNEKHAKEIEQMSRLHFLYLGFVFFKKHIEESLFEDPKIKKHLRTLLLIHGLEELHIDSMPLFESGFFRKGHYKLVVGALRTACQQIRPQIIPLVEAADFNPISAIGHADGEIYERQFEWAKHSRLNEGRHPTGFEHLQKAMHARL